MDRYRYEYTLVFLYLKDLHVQATVRPVLEMLMELRVQSAFLENSTELTVSAKIVSIVQILQVIVSFFRIIVKILAQNAMIICT